MHQICTIVFQPLLRRGAFDSAKNHKRQRRKVPVRNRQTRKVANAKVRLG